MTIEFSEIYDKLDKLAIEVLVDYDLCKLPIDIEKLAKCLKIKLIPKTQLEQNPIFDNQELNIDDGYLFAPEGGKIKWIVYNDLNIVERCRFTFAHEIAHYLLLMELPMFANDESLTDHLAKVLLCHPRILHMLNQINEKEISKAFYVSNSVACYSSESARKYKSKCTNIKLKDFEWEFISNLVKNKSLKYDEQTKSYSLVLK